MNLVNPAPLPAACGGTQGLVPENLKRSPDEKTTSTLGLAAGLPEATLSSEGSGEEIRAQNGPHPREDDFNRGLQFWAIIIGLGITNLLGALENTVVSTSAPVILSDLKLQSNYIWITNAFFVCSAAFQPLFGQLCNVFGRRWVTLCIVASKFIFHLSARLTSPAGSQLT